MGLLLEISKNLQKGKAKIVPELVTQALSEGIPATQILNEGLMAAMDIIGEKFKNNEVYVPEVVMAARAMNSGMEILKPKLMESGVEPIGKAIIGTVKGDQHDIGKNLVCMMFEAKGIEVIDLGVNVTASAFYEAYENEKAQIIACSALLTTTMGEMKNVVDLFAEKGVRAQVTIMVGGAPVTESYAKSIGADIYTADAASAAEEAKKVLMR